MIQKYVHDGVYIKFDLYCTISTFIPQSFINKYTLSLMKIRSTKFLMEHHYKSDVRPYL